MGTWKQCEELLLKILRIEILRIRSFSSEGNCSAAYAISDHIHNIPAMIHSERWDLLDGYLSGDVSSYLLTQGDVPQLVPFWDKLRQLSENRAGV